MKWSAEETEFIIRNYSSKGRNYCAEVLGRTIQSVSGKARRHRLFSTVTKANRVAEEYTSWLTSKRPNIVALSPYILSSTAIPHKDLTCGHTWDAPPNRIKSGSGCPHCAHNKPWTTESYRQKISGLEVELLEPYRPNDTPLLHKHKLCGHEWLARLRDIVRGHSCPKCARKPYSKVAIKWLSSFNNPRILHAENGGEAIVAGYKVDGYDPKTNTVYEFHGDVFHGNLDIYSPDEYCHPFNKEKTADELWQDTFDKMHKLSKVATVIYIWEKDYRDGKTFSEF